MNTVTINAGTCGCTKCCQTDVSKRVSERIPVEIQWAHRLTPGVWTLKSVEHTIRQASGASLAIPEWKSDQSYNAGAQVTYGGVIYTAAVAAQAGAVPTNAAAGVWTTANEVTADLFIPRDTDEKPLEWVDSTFASTTAIVEAGLDDTDYRLVAHATFRNCQCQTVTLEECARIAVKNCSACS